MCAERQKDVLSMLFAVQFSILVLVIPSLWPLLLLPVAVTLRVLKREYERRLAEASE